MYKENPKVNYLHSDGLDESPLSGDEIDGEELHKILAYHNHEYKKKRKLESQVEKTYN